MTGEFRKNSTARPFPWGFVVVVALIWIIGGAILYAAVNP